MRTLSGMTGLGCPRAYSVHTMGKPMHVKTRKELLASVKPSMRQHLRPDTGDMPDGERPPPSKHTPFIPLVPQAV